MKRLLLSCLLFASLFAPSCFGQGQFKVLVVAIPNRYHHDYAVVAKPQFERMARIGSTAPDLWMTQATGAPVGPDALLAATEEALGVVGRR